MRLATSQSDCISSPRRATNDDDDDGGEEMMNTTSGFGRGGGKAQRGNDRMMSNPLVSDKQAKLEKARGKAQKLQGEDAKLDLDF